MKKVVRYGGTKGASNDIGRELQMREERDQGWSFVRIKVTTEFMQYFFINGENCFRVSAGLSKMHIFKGVERDINTLAYYFYFYYGEVPEGTSVLTITPEFEDIAALYKL